MCINSLVVLLLILDVLHNTVFVSLCISERAITGFPFFEHREQVAATAHKIASSYLQVMNERGDSDGRMQTNTQVNMVRHSTDTVEHTLVLTTEAKDVHIEVALVLLSNDRSIAMGTEDDVVNQFRISHDVIDGAPF